MHAKITTILFSATAFWAASVLAQISDPIPGAIEKQGLRVEIRELARLPDSRGLHPADEDVAPNAWARVSFVRDLPDGRRFANDSRGLLYELDDDNQPSLYLDLAAVFPNSNYRGLESGFIGFEFHPEFAQNGLLYSVHGEIAEGSSAALDFIPPGFSPEDVTYHNVIIEWHSVNPEAAVFEGTRRELFRAGHVVENFFHPFGYLGFNPTSEPGDPDYGLLYTSGSDLGFSNGGGPNGADSSQLQRLDTVVGAILRIDPRSPSESGGTKGLGDYTIPPNNPFAADDDPNTLGEIYAHGFRNVHRMSWDLSDGTLFASDIGNSNIEEINIVREGGNYGWFQREGFYDNGVDIPGSDMEQVHSLPVDILDGRTEDGFEYPVAVYDHDEGVAVTAGFAYRGSVPELTGKFVFGDIREGRLFAADVAEMKAADDGVPGTVAPIEEIQLYVRDAEGNSRDVTLWELVEESMGATIQRADLHISESRDGELFITSRQDGIIRTLVGEAE
jgi:hypothetical protein